MAPTSLRLSVSGSEQLITVDHVVAGSGYTLHIDRLSFFDPALRSHIVQQNGAPDPGVYFIGPLSQMSFGPLFRFVVGADYSARTLSAHLARQTG